MIGLLVGGAFVNGRVQVTLWVIAIMLDWGGPAVVGVAEWRLVPAHFAERHDYATEGRERNALARDSYSYLHFPMVARIVLGALGLKETLYETFFVYDERRTAYATG